MKVRLKYLSIERTSEGRMVGLLPRPKVRQ